MSLADELLADLEEAGEVEDEHLYQLDAPVQEVEDIPMEVENKFQTIRDIAKLRDSEQLQRVMREITERSHSERKDAIGPVEADPEYQLIVEANNLAVEIDNEINIIHKFTRDKYSKRFPELESLVPELGNDLDKAKNSEKLQEFLTPATIMVVSVTASTTQGQLLTDDDLEVIVEACDMAIELDNYKQEIYNYVESRMSFIAPNLSIIVGASTAAKLMGVAGGLSHLAKMPACNIQVLGSQRRTLAGFSTTAIMPHTGFVHSSDIVQNTPADLRRKAARLVAAKCALAARVDGFHESPDGQVGHSLREDIERKLDKLQEPPPVKQVKPLPAPIDQPHKKRGGRRVRKMKERYAITEFRKQANRMNFGEIEEDAYQDDLGFSLGQVGKAGTGRIRAPQIDEKTKVRISKTLQGLEIVNPQAAEKKGTESAKYFSNTSGFIKVERKT
ncbi:unnamed protein product [Larinioides sclopetarius]|uniref:U4/U6 small nuclear ribonucleoprotein Prp31 n=1 Tax=Larinioides sclopetarius TaxID=280406 RepID=A0AAV2BFS1_9ARAC